MNAAPVAAHQYSVTTEPRRERGLEPHTNTRLSRPAREKVHFLSLKVSRKVWDPSFGQFLILKLSSTRRTTWVVQGQSQAITRITLFFLLSLFLNFSGQKTTVRAARIERGMKHRRFAGEGAFELPESAVTWSLQVTRQPLGLSTCIKLTMIPQ